MFSHKSFSDLPPAIKNAIAVLVPDTTSPNVVADVIITQPKNTFSVIAGLASEHVMTFIHYYRQTEAFRKLYSRYLNICQHGQPEQPSVLVVDPFEDIFASVDQKTIKKPLPEFDPYETLCFALAVDEIRFVGLANVPLLRKAKKQVYEHCNARQQACLDVLEISLLMTQLTKDWRYIKNPEKITGFINLGWGCLNDEDKDLQGAFWPGANLEQATICNVNLSGANLTSAWLWRVSMSNVNLPGADLRHANLSNGKMDSVNLENACLEYADLSGVKCNKVNMRGAKLKGANLVGVNLNALDLQGADLTDVILISVNAFAMSQYLSTELSLLANQLAKHAQADQLRQALVNQIRSYTLGMADHRVAAVFLETAINHPVFAHHVSTSARTMNKVTHFFTSTQVVMSPEQKQLLQVKKSLEGNVSRRDGNSLSSIALHN